MRATSILLCIALGAGLPQAARAGSPDASASSVGPVRVEVAESAGDVDMMRTWMLDAASQGMADAKVAVDEVLPGRELVVQIEGVVFDYQYLVGVRGPEGWIGTAQSMACSCKDDDLVARVRAAAADASPRLKGDPSVPVGPGEVGPKRRGLGPKGIAGAVLLGAGVAGIVGGAVLLTRPEDRSTKSDDLQRYEGTTTKPAGIAVLVLGGAAVVTGAVLLAVGLKARKKSVAWRPTFGARFVGIAVGGKF